MLQGASASGKASISQDFDWWKGPGNSKFSSRWEVFLGRITSWSIPKNGQGGTHHWSHHIHGTNWCHSVESSKTNQTGSNLPWKVKQAHRIKAGILPIRSTSWCFTLLRQIRKSLFRFLSWSTFKYLFGSLFIYLNCLQLLWHCLVVLLTALSL